MQKYIKTIFLLYLFTLTCVISNNAQTPTPTPTPDTKEDVVKITTEEIQLSITAKNEYGYFDPTVVPDDLVVMEDRVPQDVVSVRRVPASVLFLLDTGGEVRLAKNIKITREAALSILKSLKTNDSVAVIEYHDKVNLLQDWTTNREDLTNALNKKLNFGKRSNLLNALAEALELFGKSPTENKHLILISDGTDSSNNKSEYQNVLQRLVNANVSVHILSYTQMELKRLTESGGVWQKGEARPKRQNEEILITQPDVIQQQMRLPRIGSINTDREMLKARKQRKESLESGQKALTSVAQDTGGEMVLPLNAEEMIEKGKIIASTIESQYVITYSPKRPFSESKEGEIRVVDVLPRRQGLKIQSRKKIVVNNNFKSDYQEKSVN
jgi:VWFA-related protein